MVCVLFAHFLCLEKKETNSPHEKPQTLQNHHFYGHKPGLTLIMRFILKPAVWYLSPYFLVSCDVQSSHKLCYIWGTILSYFTGQRMNAPSVPWYRGVILLHIHLKSKCSTEIGESRGKGWTLNMEGEVWSRISPVEAFRENKRMIKAWNFLRTWFVNVTMGWWGMKNKQVL